MGNESFSERIKEKVFKHINGSAIVFQKDLVLVLESHLLFEALMDEILRLFVLDDDFYKEIQLRFFEKVKIIQKRKILDEDLITVLGEVNRIRNIFAHNLEASIDKDVDLTKLVSISRSKTIRKEVFDKVAGEKKALFATCSIYCLGQMTTQVEEFLKKNKMN